MSDGANIHLLIANLTSQTQSCAIDGINGDGALVRSLDASTVSHATAQPLQFRSQLSWTPLSGPKLRLPLAPYSVTTIVTGIDLPTANDSLRERKIAPAMSRLLGIDLGTTWFKAVVYDEQGATLSSSRVSPPDEQILVDGFRVAVWRPEKLWEVVCALFGGPSMLS